MIYWQRWSDEAADEVQVLLGSGAERERKNTSRGSRGETERPAKHGKTEW